MGEDVFNLFVSHTISIPVYKLSAITSDWKPAMIGNANGFIALTKKTAFSLNIFCLIIALSAKMLYASKFFLFNMT